MIHRSVHICCVLTMECLRLLRHLVQIYADLQNIEVEVKHYSKVPMFVPSAQCAPVVNCFFCFLFLSATFMMSSCIF